MKLSEMTDQQKTALRELYERDRSGNASFSEFVEKAGPMIGGGGCIMVPWCGMFVGIETDGHRHT